MALNHSLFKIGLKNRAQYPAVSAYLPYNIDIGDAVPVTSAIINNVFYLSLWAFFHSAMARQPTKKQLLKFIPECIERPLYVLQSAFLLHQVLRNWQALPTVVYEFPDTVKPFMTAGYLFGWLFLVSSTFAIDHFELFGLRQGLGMGNFLRLQSQETFVTRFHYNLVRHPIMTGFFIMFWSTPIMTQGFLKLKFWKIKFSKYSVSKSVTGHLLFSAVATSYIYIAVKYFEEPDLVRMIGPQYEEYMAKTPSFCPLYPMNTKSKSS